MKTLFVLFGCIFLNSCLFLNGENRLHYLIQKKWIGLSQLTEINEMVEKRKKIVSPPFTWIRLLSSSQFSLCYRTPFKKKKGLLKFVKGIKCFGDGIQTLTQIDELKVELEVEKLTINFKRLEESISWEVLLPNYKGPMVKKIGTYALAESKIFTATYVDNVKLLAKPPQFIKEGILNYCYRVDDNCKVILENNCRHCNGVWIELVEKNYCKGGGTRVCKDFNCGERNQPACLRSKQNIKGAKCFSNRDLGFCQKGLLKECVNDILMCL